MVKQMLDLANYRVSDQEELRMSIQFKSLRSQTPSPLIVPLQNSLTVVMPSSVIDQYTHKPFPADLPRINSKRMSYLSLCTTTQYHFQGSMTRLM